MSAPAVNLAFVWHMHQPCYVDPVTGRLTMPWVRLHGASAYYDLAELIRQHDGLRCTVNMSPTLLDQLDLYQAGAEDAYEVLTRRPAAELTSEERVFLVRHFFSTHWTAVVAQIPCYQRLLEKRGHVIPAGSESEVAARFSGEELRDLQVLFNLSWLGTAAAADAEIQALVARAQGYTEADKSVVLNRQRQLLRDVLPAWQGLQRRGAVELLCCPYYHPILPLLLDSNIAKRSTPSLRLPERFCFAQDAAAQLQQALERVAEVFGTTPQGLWPAELAVCPEILPIVEQAGLSYLITDAELLFRSLDDRGSTPGRRRLYQPYKVGGCSLFFRDRHLSDRLAKEYCTWSDPRAAAADFLERVREVPRFAKMDDDAPPLVVIALDGENPWEAYPRRGHDFLSELFGQLARTEDIRTVTLGGYLADHPPVVGLEHLHSGSWIEANYTIWIGDADKNRAWSLLGRARRRLDRAVTSAEASPETLARALTHLYRAEGSDWFWWLGEPFSSAEEQTYDALFRGHVTAAYQELGDNPPAELSRPVAQGGVVNPLRPPSSFIQPRIDGERTSYYEWRGAGYYRLSGAGSAHTPSLITGIYWGFDPGRIFLRVDPADEAQELMTSTSGIELRFELTGPTRRIEGRLELGASAPLKLRAAGNGGPLEELGTVEDVAAAGVLEMAIPLSRLSLQPGTRLGLSLHLSRDGHLLARVPRQGVIEVEIPGDDFGSETV